MTRLIGCGLAVLILMGSMAVTAQEPPLTGEPDVTIRQEGAKTIEEYRLNGFLYAIKVIPKKGAPYFLVAVDDDGNFTRADAPNGMRIPSWKIFEW